jgi:transcriptional regulator with XRE-family HTH domain
MSAQGPDSSTDSYPVATLDEWLGLSAAEVAYIHICNSLVEVVRAARERAGLTQAQAARKLKSSQSRVSKMENGDPSVSLDLLVTSALALGASRDEIANAVAGGTPTQDSPSASREMAAPKRASRRSAQRAAA